MTRSEPHGPVPFAISGPLTSGDIPALVRRLKSRLEEGDGVAVRCDVDRLGPPDAVALDALARLQRIAKRLGASIQLENPCPRLQDLLAITGLDAVLPVADEGGPAPGPGSAVGGGCQCGREPEVVEERPVDVDEVVDRGDLSA